MPQASIIMPAYRAQAHIARAVRSVLAQTMPDWELVIISDDGVCYLDLLSQQGISDARIREVGTGAMATGSSHARNIGLKAAWARYVAFLDADDVFYPEKLAKMLPYAMRYGMCSCALANTRYLPQRELLAEIGAGEDRCLTAAQYLLTNFSASNMLVVDRNAVPISWNEDAPVMVDMLYAMAAFDYIPECYHVGEILHEYIFTKDSISTRAGAPQRYLQTKYTMLGHLDLPSYGIHDAHSRKALRNFLKQSILAEQRYQLALTQENPESFTQILAECLRDAA